MRSGVYRTNDDAGGQGVFGRNLANSDAWSGAGPNAGAEGAHGPSGTFGALGPASAGVRATGTSDRPALVVDGTVSFLRTGAADALKGKSSVRVTGIDFGQAEIASAMLPAYRLGVAVSGKITGLVAGTITVYLTKKATVITPVLWYLLGSPMA